MYGVRCVRCVHTVNDEDKGLEEKHVVRITRIRDVQLKRSIKRARKPGRAHRANSTRVAESNHSKCRRNIGKSYLADCDRLRESAVTVERERSRSVDRTPN